LVIADAGQPGEGDGGQQQADQQGKSDWAHCVLLLDV
jgi:hypothetical protein